MSTIFIFVGPASFVVWFHILLPMAGDISANLQHAVEETSVFTLLSSVRGIEDIWTIISIGTVGFEGVGETVNDGDVLDRYVATPRLKPFRFRVDFDVYIKDMRFQWWISIGNRTL